MWSVGSLCASHSLSVYDRESLTVSVSLTCVTANIITRFKHSKKIIVDVEV